MWGMAMRQLWRDFRAGELRLLALAVTLAVAALTAVGFFADRLNNGLARDARQLLGADAVVVSDKTTPPGFAQRADALGLAQARTVVFPSMARAPDELGGATRLAAVKAVSDGYPLRGALQLAMPDGPGRETVAEGPPRGAVWVERGILESLGLAVGQDLWLGDARLRIERVILFEPDRGAGFINFSPRVMLHEDDLAATGLIQPASRVTYRLLVAGRQDTAQADAAVRAYVREVEDAIDVRGLRGIHVESLDSGRPEMEQTLDRAEKFLNLVALLSALLAAVAVGIGARDFANRHLDDCALLRVLGQPQRTIAGAYAIEFVLVGALASLAGVVIGYGVHHVFVVLLAGLVDAQLPAATPWPAAFGLAVGLTLLVGFGLPPVLQLARVPALRVIRRELGELRASSLAVLVAGAVGFAGLLLAVAADLRLGLLVVGGFAGAVAVFAGLSWVAIWLLQRAVPQASAPRWLVLATRQLGARPGFAVLQVSALSVGLLALVLLVLLRTDLISSWRAATPPDAPDRFVINIQPDQGEAFRTYLREAGVGALDWYPMIRGRLVAINDRPVRAEDFETERAQRLVEREFNLSHAAQMPQHNTLVAGRWAAEEPEGMSVEDGLASELGLRMGDRLRFDIAGVPYEARITSLRSVDWSSMRVNFFVMFPRERLEGLPSTYIAAFQAPRGPDGQARAGFDAQLGQRFPNITNVDVSASLAQVQRVLDQVIRAVEFLFVFTLASGLVVLFAAVVATREQRSREFAIMRALGAGRALLSRVQRAELLGLGALSGVLAASVAVGVAWALARYVFEFAWQASPFVPLAGAVAGALLAWAAGWWGLREVLGRPVVETLRRAAQ